LYALKRRIYEGCTTKKKKLTIPDILTGNDFKFLLNIRIKQPIKIKPIRSLLPPRQIGDLVSVNYMAFASKLVDVTYFGVDSGEEQSGVGCGAVGDVRRAIVPC